MVRSLGPPCTQPLPWKGWSHARARPLTEAVTVIGASWIRRTSAPSVRLVTSRRDVSQARPPARWQSPVDGEVSGRAKGVFGIVLPFSLRQYGSTFAGADTRKAPFARKIRGAVDTIARRAGCQGKRDTLTQPALSHGLRFRWNRAAAWVFRLNKGSIGHGHHNREILEAQILSAG